MYSVSTFVEIKIKDKAEGMLISASGRLFVERFHSYSYFLALFARAHEIASLSYPQKVSKKV